MSLTLETPPLIPLPPSSPTKKTMTHAPIQSGNGSILDEFDSYTPLFRAPESNGVKPHVQPPPVKHIRTTSIESAFGDFVSVSPSQDPLAHPTSPNGGPEPTSPFGEFTAASAAASYQNPSGTSYDDDDFFESAKMRSKANERRVLDELLEHEDDPMYWVGTSKSQSESPIPPAPPTSSPGSGSGILIDMESDSGRRGNPNRHPSPPTSRSSTSPKRPQSQTRHSPPALITRQMSQPTLGSSPPEKPIHDPMAASFTSSGGASKILGTLRSNSSSSTPSPSGSPITKPSLLSSSLSKSFFGTGVYNTVKAKTPFTRDVFVPPSGAPGFEGDRDWNTRHFSFSESENKYGLGMKSVVLTGRKETTESVLDVGMADALRPHLPALTRLAPTWKLLYSLDQHGISLGTFYEKCATHEGGAMLVIQDTDGCMFGAWISEGLGMRDGGGRYYGSGDSFLWKDTSHVLPSRKVQNAVKVFRWTGTNDYVALCETDSVSFGGGDGHYGLYLSSSLIDGSSATCPTFANDVLCGRGGGKGGRRNVPFECIGVEVWGVGMV